MTISAGIDPPPYIPVERPYVPAENAVPSNKAYENRLKIIVGLDYGTTNSGKLEQYQTKLAMKIDWVQRHLLRNVRPDLRRQNRGNPTMAQRPRNDRQSPLSLRLSI